MIQEPIILGKNTRYPLKGLLTLPEGKGGGHIARQHPDRVRLLPIQNPHELMDADTPEDLAHLLSLYRKMT